MRVLHVVTLLSRTGAFGGPLRVALNHCVELGRQGHDSRLVAGWADEGRPPSEVEGVPVELFPVRPLLSGGGFSSLFSPGLAHYVRAQANDLDVIHLHAGRDLVSLTAAAAARSRKLPVVTQSHGMIGVDRRWKARALDAVLVRRLLGSAAVNLSLTPYEDGQLRQVLGEQARIRRLRNGVPAADAQARPEQEEVVFAARLHRRKRPLAFVDMAALVHEKRPETRFAMIGPDEGELSDVRRTLDLRGLTATVCYEGALPYDAVVPRLARAGIYVLPSVDEPFPMSLLEALSTGLACICTSSCHISGELQAAGAALVTDGSPRQLADAVLGLLGDPAARARLMHRGRQYAAEHFSASAVAADLLKHYQRAVGGHTASGEPAGVEGPYGDGGTRT